MKNDSPDTYEGSAEPNEGWIYPGIACTTIGSTGVAVGVNGTTQVSGWTCRWYANDATASLGSAWRPGWSYC